MPSGVLIIELLNKHRVMSTDVDTKCSYLFTATIKSYRLVTHVLFMKCYRTQSLQFDISHLFDTLYRQSQMRIPHSRTVYLHSMDNKCKMLLLKRGKAYIAYYSSGQIKEAHARKRNASLLCLEERSINYQKTLYVRKVLMLRIFALELRMLRLYFTGIRSIWSENIFFVILSISSVMICVNVGPVD